MSVDFTIHASIIQPVAIIAHLKSYSVVNEKIIIAQVDGALRGGATFSMYTLRWFAQFFENSDRIAAFIFDNHRRGAIKMAVGGAFFFADL